MNPSAKTPGRRFADEVAVVTGGGTGIGAAIAKRFDAEGAVVAVLDLDVAKAQAQTASFRRGLALECDVGVAASVEEAFSRIARELGDASIVVNNAGIAGSPEQIVRRSDAMEAYTTELLETLQPPGAPIDLTIALSDEEWRRMMAGHVDGTFYVTRAALQAMVPRRRGSIVNMASTCGIAGCVGASAYSAAKAAVIGFTRAVAKEVAMQGVRVNAVAPGNIDTTLSPVRSRAERSLAVAMTPLGRLGRPDEVADTVLFLASDEASYYTGAVLSPSGGALTA